MHEDFILPGPDVMIPILHDLPITYVLTDLGWAVQS